MKFLWAPKTGGDINAPALVDAHGHQGAMTLIKQAQDAINGIGERDLERTRTNRGGDTSLPKYVVAIGIAFDPSKADELRKAADAFDKANEASGSPIKYSVYSSDSDGRRLILLGADELDRSVLQRLANYENSAKAKATIGSLEGIVTRTHAVPFEKVPELIDG